MKLSSLSSGLCGHWPLDKESFNPATKRFTDRSAYSNHGIGVGTQLGSADPGFQADRMGQLVRSAPFNGIDDYVRVQKPILSSAGSVTISFWLNVEVQSSDWSRVMMDSFSGVSIILGSDGSTGLYGSVGDGASGWLLSNEDITGGWKHVIITASSSDGYIRSYLDGQLVGANSRGFSATTLDDLFIGSELGISFLAEGSLSDVRIYNRALSQQEITLLYESYRPKLVIGTP